MSSELRIVYITFPDADLAQKTGKILVEEGLAACVNIYPSVNSIYKWQGQICQESELVLLAKTRVNLVARLMQRVKELHSYDCPPMLSIVVDEASADYEDWLFKALAE